MQLPILSLRYDRRQHHFFALAPNVLHPLYRAAIGLATQLAQPLKHASSTPRNQYSDQTLLLKSEKLAIRRGARLIIDGLSFETAAGEALLLTGPNGAGKTTLLRSIAGFLTPEDGQISLRGGDDELEVGEQSHYVGHANGIKSNLTVAENLEFWCAYLNGNSDRTVRRDRVERALELMQLSSLEDIPAAYLSAGQKRRLGLGRLLVADRPLWLLDEPTVSLDAASVKLLASIVEKHLEGGGLALAATHIPLGLEHARELRLGVKRQAA